MDCCRANFQQGGDAGFSEREVDWPRFLDLIRRHRIEGLAARHLSHSADRVPRDVLESLAQSARLIATQNLQASAECRLLRDRFSDGDLPLLFLKGLTVGALAYGNPAIKSAIDIDILIDPADLDRAAEQMKAAGYTLQTPKDSPQNTVLRRWHRSWKESVWAKGAVQLDLHTRLADNPRLIPRIDVHSPRQIVDVGNGALLPTLAIDELFAYLAIHGASSAWFRLKWISDFAGILNGKSRDELKRLYRRSQELGAARAAGQALLISDTLFGTLQPAPELLEALRRSPETMRLRRTALRLLTAEEEPTERRGGTWPIHRSQFDLAPGPKFKLSQLWHQARRRGSGFI